MVDRMSPGDTVRFRAEQTAAALLAAEWAGELIELREIVTREFRALRSAFDAAEVTG